MPRPPSLVVFTCRCSEGEKSMQVINFTRKFRYNSLTLQDPNESMTLDQVREFYATQFPELNNALVEGPKTENGVSTWTFLRAAGAKGRMSAVEAPGGTSMARTLIHASLKPVEAPGAALPERSEGGQYVARLVQVLASRREGGQAMNPPSSAFGIWG